MTYSHGRRRIAATFLVLTCIPLTTPAPVEASPHRGSGRARLDTVVTMLGAPTYFLGQADRLYYPGNSRITLTGNYESFGVRVEGKDGDTWDLSFGAPSGQVLAPGDYEDAANSPSSARGSISIGGGGLSCGQTRGRFTINSIDVSEGVPTSLWLTYVQGCSLHDANPIFGEIRYHMPRETGKLNVAPRALRLPDLDRGGAARLFPVVVYNEGFKKRSLRSVELVSDSDPQFAIASNLCRHKAIPRRRGCVVILRFTPAREGDASAGLRIEEKGRVGHLVVVAAHVFGGRTEFSIQSDEGDFIGQGESWTNDAHSGPLGAGGTAHSLSVVSSDVERDLYAAASFEAPRGEDLVVGRTYEATRANVGQAGAGLSVGIDSRGCNELDGTFTVTDLAVNVNGEVTRFGATFEQHCEHQAPVLRGTVGFRAEDAPA